MLKKVLEFLFGKEPDIFDENGRVQHNLPKEKWENWHKRYMGGEEFNWRTHTGTRSGVRRDPQDTHRPKS